MHLYTITKELIDIPSLTGDEAAIEVYLRTRLEALGFHVDRQEVAPRRANLIATHSDAPPHIVFSTHMDTVPPHIPSSEDEEFIYGRGACDTKGIIAAQLCAAEQLLEQGVRNIGFLFTVDEEMSSLGAKIANEHSRAAECQFLINGEPTDNRLAIGSKGSLRVRLHTRGRAAHSAYPEHGDSAILKLLDVLSDMRECELPTNDFFGESTCNIGVIAGGARPNVVPDEAHADLQIRLVTQSSVIKEILDTTIAGRAQIEYLSSAEPVRMLAVEGFEQCVVRFTTDVPYLTKWGNPLLFGPGSILDAHTTDEKISKHQLADAVTLYVKLTHELLKRIDA